MSLSSPILGYSLLFLPFSLRHPLGILLLLKYLFIFFLSLLFVGRVFSYHCLLFKKSIFSHFSLFILLVSCDSFSFFVLLFTSFLPWCFFSASFHNFLLYLHNLFFLFLQLTVLFDCLNFCDFSHIKVFSFLLSLNSSTSTQTGNALSWNKGFHDISIASIPSFSKTTCVLSQFLFLYHPPKHTLHLLVLYSCFSLCLYPLRSFSSITRRTRMTWTNWGRRKDIFMHSHENGYIPHAFEPHLVIIQVQSWLLCLRGS